MLRVCLLRATELERCADDMDTSNMIGTPVKVGDSTIGVVTKAWVEDGALYANLEVRADIEEHIADA